MASRTLKLTLLADSDRFGKGVDQAEGKLGKLGGGIKTAAKVAAAGTAAVAGLAAGAFALANKASQAGDKIGKGAEKLGVSTDAYQELDYWASQNGVSHDAMSRAVGRLNQRIGNAADGTGKYAKAFDALGVELHGTNGELRSTEDVLGDTIEALRAVEDPALRSTMAADVFGTKMARDLMPALSDSAMSLEEAKQQAHELGAVMSEDSVRASERFQDGLDNIKRAASGLMQQGAAPLIEFFADVAFPFIENKLVPALGVLREWIGPRLTAATGQLTGFLSGTVMPTLQRLASWFVDRVLPAARRLLAWFTGTLVPGIRATVVPIIDGLRNALETIRERFQGNGEAAGRLWREVLQPLVEFIVTKVAPVVGTVLGGALTVLGEIIGRVIDVVVWLVERISDLVGWFRRAKDSVSGVLGPLGSFVDLAGKAMDGARGLASGAVDRVRGWIPGLASGGIVTGPTLAMVGEGTEAEAVLPLSKLQALLDGGGGGPTINVTGTMLDPEGVARAVEAALERSRRLTGGRAVALA